MKKLCSIALLLIVVSVLFITGCTDKKNAKISFTHGKGKITIIVPKDIYGYPMFDIFYTKPDELPISQRFYLTTNDAFIGFSDNAFSYNTSKEYKKKYGKKKATFDNYLEYIEDKELFNKEDFPGLEQIEINGRRTLRYCNRVEENGSYVYYGFSYIIEVDDIYPEAAFNITAYYRSDLYDLPTEPREFDEETQKIINSIKITKNR